MSNYFNHRIRRIPVTDNNQHNHSTSSTSPEIVATLSDDELLSGALEFEKSEEFKKAQEDLLKLKEKEGNRNNSNSTIHPFFQQSKSPTKINANSNSSIANNNRLSNEIKTIVSTSKKRAANDSSDDEVIAISDKSPAVVRPPIKRIPNSKPDFHSFVPPNQKVTERMKTLIHNLGVYGASGETSRILAREQLRVREALMRKEKQAATASKPENQEKKSTESTKRKLNDNDHVNAKKIRPVPKNAFDKLVQEMTDNMTRVTLTTTTATLTTSVSTIAVSSYPLVDLTVTPATSTVASTLVLQSTSQTNLTEKNSKPKKIYTYDDYILHILKWPTSLLDETELEPNILYKEFFVENTYPVPVLELYSCFEEYEQITLPWLFEETFEEIKRSIKMGDHKLAKFEFEAVLPQIRLFKSGHYELKSQTLYKRATPSDKRPDMLNEDDLVIITSMDSPVKKFFGLIRSGERITEKARLHKSLVDHPDVKIRPPTWLCQEYTIRMFGNEMKIKDGSKIKIQAITSLTATLRRFKALASMRSCPLFQYLLSPSLSEPVFQLSNNVNNIIEEKYFQAYNESQRKVISEAVSMVWETKDDEPGKIYMCQGPPGTGKSQTITGIIRALLKPLLPISLDEQSSIVSSSSSSTTQKKTKILICCPSNGGCNEIVRRLIDTFARPTADENGKPKRSKLPFKLIRCARGGGVSEDIENVSLEILAQKCLEEVLNTGGQNEAIERNLANKEKQKKQLIQRIELEKQKQSHTGSNIPSEELKDLELNLNEITESIAKLQQTSRKAIPESIRRQREREIKIALIKEADVCVSTLNYVGNSIFDSFAPFDSLQDPKNAVNAKKLPESAVTNLFNCLIIDEAGQCIEIDNYIPLRLGINRVILVGDPEQLPATVLSRRAAEAGLNQSLFERLYRLFKYDVNNPIRMLSIQYRMHEEICKFPSMHIYRSKLKTDKATHQKRKKFMLKPYMVLDIGEGQEQLDSITQSYGNPVEAEMTVYLVKFIHERAKVPFNQIGIITPYNYQLKLIEQRLAQYNMREQKIDLGTVDAFQGRQKDVILLSCVRAPPVNDLPTTTTMNSSATTNVSIGFVANRQRLNVSLTRAKYAMYILGHMNSLTSNEDWKKLYTNAIERKTILALRSTQQFTLLIKGNQEEANGSDPKMPIDTSQ